MKYLEGIMSISKNLYMQWHKEHNHKGNATREIHKWHCVIMLDGPKLEDPQHHIFHIDERNKSLL